MIEELIERVWNNPKFHEQAASLNRAWLRNELALDEHAILGETALRQCVQAAAILAASENPEHQRAAFSAAACAADLRRGDLPGLDGALRVVLTRMGNFPALRTSPTVGGFTRLPLQVALAEEERREANAVRIGELVLELTDFQRELWNVLTDGYNAAISAPTSTGKSFVLQAYLRELARENRIKTACYIVPSRALIAQVSDEIAEWRKVDGLKSLALVTIPLGSETSLPPKAIHVLTQERLQATLTAHPEFAAELIICDEAQNIEEGARGVLLQNVVDQLLIRTPLAQTVFAGPNIRNLSAFRRIFELKLVSEVQSRSPSVVQNLILVNTRSLIKGQLELQRFGEQEEAPIGIANIEKPLPTITERLVRVAERFGRTKPSIIYANGPADAERTAKGLAEVAGEYEPTQQIRDLIALAKAAVHSEYSLGATLQSGVAFHYGRIPALIRRGIETAFAEGQINFLVTTSTLIQGVNFPAANLFVCKPKKGSNKELDPAEFWNLAGRAGRLGKEFQGKIFLIDYHEWKVKHADESNEIEIRSSLQRTLSDQIQEVMDCARNTDPPFEKEALVSVEASFARLFADQGRGRLERTLETCDVPPHLHAEIAAAISFARSQVTLPEDVLAFSPTLSALRQQRLFAYLKSELNGGGEKRLAELLPRHPRDDDAYLRLSEVFKVCHRKLLGLDAKTAPKLHSRMAAIAVKWMRGDPVPEIVEENHKRSEGRDIAASIRDTLNDIEQEIRFKYLRLTTCYNAVFAHALETTGHARYIPSIPHLPNFLEVGAADQTMISLIGMGISRVTARVLTDSTMNKDMDQAEALAWLREQNIQALVASPLMQADISRALATQAG